MVYLVDMINPVTYPVVTRQCDFLRVEDEVEKKQNSKHRIISQQDQHWVVFTLGHKHPTTKYG